MTFETLGPLMFVVLFLLIFVGYPVAFSLGGTALAFTVIGVPSGALIAPALRSTVTPA